MGKKKSITLPCTHKFHELCLAEWVKHNNNCPICRSVIDLDEWSAMEDIMRMGHAVAVMTHTRTEETWAKFEESVKSTQSRFLEPNSSYWTVFDPEWMPNDPQFKERLVEFAKNLVLNLVVGGEVWAFRNAGFVTLIVKLGQLAPAMIPVLMHPPGIDGGLMGMMEVYVQNLHNAFLRLPAGSEQRRSARQMLQKFREWSGWMKTT